MVSVPRMPSSSQINAQIRAAARQAERQVMREADRIGRELQRKLEADARAAQARAASQFRSDVNAIARSAPASPRISTTRTITYTEPQRRTLTPWAESAEAHGSEAEVDLFLSHAWLDRASTAATLFEKLSECGLSVWFSEVELKMGVSLSRQIDRALAKCKAGLVLVTPAFLTAVETGTWAEKELGVLLGSDRVIPVLHEVSFADLRRVSPMLADKVGLSTAEEPLGSIAEKIAAGLRR